MNEWIFDERYLRITMWDNDLTSNDLRASWLFHIMVYKEMYYQITAAILCDKVRLIYACQTLCWGKYTSTTPDEGTQNSDYGGMSIYMHA